MKPKPHLVIGQIGGRRYVAAVRDSESEALSLALARNQSERALTRKPGQTMTRFFVYSLVEAD